jgi:hypothetical protein
LVPQEEIRSLRRGRALTDIQTSGLVTNGMSKAESYRDS